MMKKNCDDMLSRFHLYLNVTDRQTGGQTDRFAISISRVSMLTRDNKSRFSNNILLYVGNDAR